MHISKSMPVPDTEPFPLPKAQEIYRHFKGNLYQIVTVAKHSETGELLVIYQALYGDFTVYARPLSMFMEKVDRVKYPQETQEYRFELQDLSRLPDTALENRQGPAPEEEKIKFSRQDSLHAAEFTVEAEKTGPEKEADTEDAAAVDGETVPLDPLVVEFLDAGSYEERLNILAGLHHRVTDDMINVMAMAADIEVPSGDIEKRYTELRECLMKLEKYECSRLR